MQFNNLIKSFKQKRVRIFVAFLIIFLFSYISYLDLLTYLATCYLFIEAILWFISWLFGPFAIPVEDRGRYETPTVTVGKHRRARKRNRRMRRKR